MFKVHRQSWCVLKLVLLLFMSGRLNIAEQRSTRYVSQACLKVVAWSNDTICNCYDNMIDMYIQYEFKCHVIGANSTISIALFWLDRIQLTCYGLDSLNYNLLPQFSKSRYSIMQIFHCPLPPRQPIRNIFLKLGLIYVHELQYNWGGPLQRIHFEGLQNLNKLSVTSNDSSNLPEDLFTDLGNLSYLDLSNNIHLPLNIFFPLKNLKFLKLKNDSLHELAPGVFQNKNELIDLNLEGNNLIGLTKKAFEEVSCIRHLDLSTNGIVTLFPDVFTFLPHLETIILTGNYIESLPDGLFARNKNLISFQLYENRVQLKQLPGRLLGNLPKLREVRLSCGVETNPEDLLVNSKNIQKITITENNLTTLPRKFFADQINLFDLNLSRNQLKSLPDEIFQNTTNLRVLRLSHNHLLTIKNNIFSALHLLKFVYLDNNDIFMIQSEQFFYKNYLEYINLEHNRLSGELGRLNVSTNLHNLIKLDLSYNNITAINNFSLRTLYSVASVVNVSHNSIQKVYLNNYEEIFLDLSHNPLNCNCELLQFVQFLKSANAIVYIKMLGEKLNKFQCTYPQNLIGRLVSKLTTTELLCPLDNESFSAKLCPEYCSCWVRAVDRVAVVNCSNTNHTEVPILPNLTLPQLNLRQVHGMEMHIENNIVSHLPNANTPGYMHVVELHASNNSLTEVLGINLPRNLTLLDLSQNKIQHLDDTTLSVLNGSRITVALAGNPWVCDCGARGLLDFVVVNNKIIRDVDQMKCEDGQKFQDAASKMICSANQNVVIAVGVVIAVVGICAGIIAAVYYKYQQEIKVWLYAHGMCFWFVSEEDLDKDKQYDAFISFSHRDEDFIADHLLPELENGPTPFKLCLHSRDWVIGEFIPNQILRSVEESRRTIIVLSPNFLESNWAQMEFRSAHNAALKEGRARVIVILYGDVGDIGSLEPELKAYLQMNTYVKWGDPWFWKKLRYAMPHRARNVPGVANAEPETANDINLQLVEPFSPLTTPAAEPEYRNSLAIE